jgi:hypothetical protein
MPIFFGSDVGGDESANFVLSRDRLPLAKPEFGPVRTEGSASIIAGSFCISGPVMAVPVQGDNSISVQHAIPLLLT